MQTPCEIAWNESAREQTDDGEARVAEHIELEALGNVDNILCIENSEKKAEEAPNRRDPVVVIWQIWHLLLKKEERTSS